MIKFFISKSLADSLSQPTPIISVKLLIIVNFVHSASSGFRFSLFSRVLQIVLSSHNCLVILGLCEHLCT